MQKLACSLGWYLKSLLLVFFLLLIATCEMYVAVASAVADPLYPTDENIADEPVRWEHYRGEGGMAVSVFNFTNFEIYKTLGKSYDAPQEVVLAKCLELARRYAAAARVDGFANYRFSFLQNAYGILEHNRRNYNTLLYLWTHPGSRLDSPELIAFVDAYTRVDRK